MALFVMRPHAEDLHDVLLPQNLIDKPMLDVDATGNRALEITNKRFVWRCDSGKWLTP